MERYLRVNLLGPGPRLILKRIYRAAVSQRLRNTGIEGLQSAGHPATPAVVRDTINGTRHYKSTFRRLLKPHPTIIHDNKASSQYYEFFLYAYSLKCQSQRDHLLAVLYPLVTCRRKSLCPDVWIAQRILK